MPIRDDQKERYPVPGVTYKTVPGIPELMVGDDGSVWSSCKRIGPRGSKSVPTENWKRKPQTTNGNGYLRVTLRGKTLYVHALILSAFVGPRPAGMQACHNDGDNSNNRPGNLRWDTIKGNHGDRKTHGTNLPGEENPQSKLSANDVVFIRRKKGVRLQILATRFNVSRSTISAIQLGKSWNHLPQTRKVEHAESLEAAG